MNERVKIIHLGGTPEFNKAYEGVTGTLYKGWHFTPDRDHQKVLQPIRLLRSQDRWVTIDDNKENETMTVETNRFRARNAMFAAIRLAKSVRELATLLGPDYTGNEGAQADWVLGATNEQWEALHRMAGESRVHQDDLRGMVAALLTAHADPNVPLTLGS